MLLPWRLLQGDLAEERRVVLLGDSRDASCAQDVRRVARCSLGIGIATFNLAWIKESFIYIIPRQLLLPPIHYLLIMSGQWRFVVKYDILEYLLRLFLHPIAEHPSLTRLFLTLLSGSNIMIVNLSCVNQVRFHGLSKHVEIFS